MGKGVGDSQREDMEEVWAGRTPTDDDIREGFIAGDYGGPVEAAFDRWWAEKFGEASE
ncbi:MAG: hypothetical protein ABWX92_07120 [Mycetocola sp.]